MIASNETETSTSTEAAKENQQLLIEKHLRNRRRRPQSVIPSLRKTDAIPLSYAQEGIWFYEKLTQGSTLYHIPICFRIYGSLHIPSLKKALGALLQRHDSLRTTFKESNGTAFQAIQGFSEELLEKSFHCETSTRDHKNPATWIHQVTDQALDLANGPVIRCHLLRVHSEEHLLVLLIHHLVCDAWSIHTILKELSLFYSAFYYNEEPKLEPQVIQFSDYAFWQRNASSSQERQNQIEYWKKQLNGIAEGTRFPTEGSLKTSKANFSGSQESLSLDSPESESLRSIAQKLECTSFILFYAAFNALLHRYTMEDTVVTGTPVSERKLKETEGVVGLFVNTVVFRSDLNGNPIFSDYVNELKETFFDHYKHSGLPFEKLIQEIHPSRSTLSNPLVHTVFAFEKVDENIFKLEGLKTIQEQIPSTTSKFDLLLTVVEQKSRFEFTIEYNKQLYSRDFIRQILNHYKCLLQSVVRDSHQRISELSILSPTEQQELLETTNATDTEYPRHKSVHQIFQEQAALHPETVAIESNHGKVTYRELDELSSQIAENLINQGARGIVGIAIPRSTELIAGLLGILKAGCAYTYVDLSQPRARIDELIKISKLQLILTTESLKDELRTIDPGIKILFFELIHRNESTRIDPIKCSVDAGKQMAYVCFTSGSTGNPKGVCISHRSVVRLVKNTNYISIQENDVFLQFAPISFDACTFEIWGPLLNGAKIVVYPPENPTLNELGEFISKNKITVLWLTSGLFNQMVDNQLNNLKTVRYLISGGDALSVRHVKKAIDCLGEGRVYNGYGPTECTTFACCHQIQREDLYRNSIPIGRPISNTQVYILDKYMQPVPVGVVGELYLGGDGVAMEYLNDPELTREKFIQNPFPSKPGKELLYRTGDLVRFLQTGAIEFLRRTDHQVKIRGFRIEPSEIEKTLNGHPGIHQSLVVPFTNQDGEKFLCAYYTLQASEKQTSNSIREFLKTKLPSYMIPSYFVPIESFPLDQNGKINRKNLPHPLEDQRQHLSENEITPPADRTEEQLLNLWKNVLGRSDFGVENGFFELGGHSLLALKLVSEIERIFSLKMPVSKVFQFPTVRELSRVIQSDEVSYVPNSIVSLQSKGSQQPLFFVHGVGGGTFWGYKNLTVYLDNDQPVYVFKSRGTDGKEEFETIEEMASHYIADLRKLQPTGPYFLGGYCFGGNVAYEMARQLKEAGEEIVFLALMNCTAANSSYSKFSFNFRSLKSFFANLSYWGLQILHWGRKQRSDFFRWKFRNLVRVLRNIVRISGSNPLKDDEVDNLVDLHDYSEDQKRLWKAHVKALLRHQTKPYDGNMILFRSPGHRMFCSFDRANGWTDFCKDVRILEVPGAHETILTEPHVRTLGNLFAAQLKKAQQTAHCLKNAKKSDRERLTSIHSFFQEQARRKPKAAAISFKGKLTSYESLDDQSTQVAIHLVNCGIRKDDVVGVFMERTPDLIIVLLGILKAGAAYLPLDPKYPKDRIQYLVSDASPKIIVTERHLKESVNRLGTCTTLADILHVKHPLRQNKLPEVSPSHLAYVIYTSGSTGNPKGVAVEHRSVIQLLHWGRRIFTDEELGGAVASTSISFDVSVFEIFVPLSWGGTIHLIENVLHLPEMVEKDRVRMVNLVPSAARELLAQKSIPQNITTLNLAGEALSSELVDKLYGLPHIKRVYDLYGPTETTVYSTWALRKPNTEATIGIPLDGEYAYILDENRSPVKNGEAGELYIGGAGLAREYLNKPSLTEERFVPNPFLTGSPDTKSRMYKTGDLASFNPDQTIRYLGRIDQQVKIRGFRIELGEIENVLKTHQSIKDAVVIATGKDEEKLLSAFIVPQNGSIDGALIKQYLSNKLPGHMVPSFIREINELPHTPSGKVDRKMLEKMSHSKIEPCPESIELTHDNPVEQRLAEIFKNILKIKKVDIRKSFFDMGGHSLMAVRLFSEIETVFNKKLPITTLIENPTVQKLAAEISHSLNGRYELIVPLKKEGNRPPLFWIHSLGGDGGGGFFYYRKLVERLNIDHPSFGVRSPKKPFDSIETMADHYTKEIQKFYDEGPYYLGGFCFGGNVAFEIARRLAVQRKQVAFLGLFESEVIHAPINYFSPSSAWNFAGNVYGRVGNLLKTPPSTTFVAAKRRFRQMNNSFRAAFDRSDSAKRLDRKFNNAIDIANYPAEYVEFASVHWKALQEHRPQPYEGQVHVLKAKQRSLFSVDPTLGWKTVTKGKVIVKEIPGTHETMFQEPNVTELAIYLQQRLEQVHQGKQ